RQTVISFDIQATHVWPRWAQIVGYSFAWQEGVAFYVPVQGPAGELVLDAGETVAALRGGLENADIRKVGQKLKYDMIVLRSAGVELAGAYFDTMIAGYLLDAGERNHGIDELALRYLKHSPSRLEDVLGTGKNQRRIEEVPLAEITRFAAEG